MILNCYGSLLYSKYYKEAISDVTEEALKRALIKIWVNAADTKTN